MFVRLSATARTLNSSRAVKPLTALLCKKSYFMRCMQELPHVPNVYDLGESLEHGQYAS